MPTGAPTGFTIKHDGFRLIVQWQGNRVRLFTRRGHDWSDRYPLMVETALAKEDLSWSSARRK